MDVKELTPTLIELLSDPKCPYLYIKELGIITTYSQCFPMELYIDPKTGYYDSARMGSVEFRAYHFKNIKPKKTDEEAGKYIKELYETYKNKIIQYNIKKCQNTQPIFLRFSQRLLDNINSQHKTGKAEYITRLYIRPPIDFSICDNIDIHHHKIISYTPEYHCITGVLEISGLENIPLFLIRQDHPHKEVELDKIGDQLKKIKLRLAEIAIKTDLDNISWIPDGIAHEPFFDL